MTTQTITTETDPVCRMQVDSASAASSEHAGKLYYFCCQGCKAKFDKNPADFLKAGGVKGSCGSGCGCSTGARR